jgi:hypothetical protein
MIVVVAITSILRRAAVLLAIADAIVVVARYSTGRIRQGSNKH